MRIFGRRIVNAVTLLLRIRPGCRPGCLRILVACAAAGAVTGVWWAQGWQWALIAACAALIAHIAISVAIEFRDSGDGA